MRPVPARTSRVFAGESQPPSPGQEVPSVAVSTGPFTPHGSVVGTTTTMPPTSNASASYVACSGPRSAFCRPLTASTPRRIRRAPTGRSRLPHYPSTASDRWPARPSHFARSRSRLGRTGSRGLHWADHPHGATSVSVRSGCSPSPCPSPTLCVAGGSGDATVGGWIETSTILSSLRPGTGVERRLLRSPSTVANTA